ncbi:uncharacterized protein [Anabrus simplex]|uniref:uncharacterized protein n=1 Tax=Anabrus simplex TaxID=316456 RepID=UPI0035A32E15
MAEELSGYLDVKVPSRVRKRGFTPWKAWNKQWCKVRREESGILVQLGNSASNTVLIPANSTLCRSNSRSRQFAFGVFHHVGQVRRPSLFLAGNTETESQKWMAHIRNLLRPYPHFDLNSQIGSCDFRVSLIDNPHSQVAGLTGFYGVLSVGARHIMLSGSSLDEVTVTWDWSHFHQFHLAATGRKEDENRICVLHTSSEFCAGPGQIYFFCMHAPKLLQCLLKKGHMYQAFPSPVPLRSGRRLSRSESDLRCYYTAEEANNASGSQDGYYSPSDFLRRPVLMRSHSGSRDSGVRVSSASDDSTQPVRGKVASSLISAGLGLLFSTPGCSETDNESLHEYQHIGSYDSDDEGEEVGALFRTNSTSTHSPRRESGISLASGIYEEILEDNVSSAVGGSSEKETQNHYENPTSLGWGKAYEESSCPPPLPPRKHNFSMQAKASMSDEALDEKSKCGYKIPGAVLVLPTPLALQQGRFQSYSASCSSLPAGAPWDHWPVRRRLLTETETEPDYVPMSPGGSSVLKSAPQHEEQHYMVMASLNSS